MAHSNLDSLSCRQSYDAQFNVQLENITDDIPIVSDASTSSPHHYVNIPKPPPLPNACYGKAIMSRRQTCYDSCFLDGMKNTWDRLFKEGHEANVHILTDDKGLILAHSNVLEMTLEEYEKVREEKRKALLALKSEERKVEMDKELKSMQQLSLKKGNDEIFIKLGSDKEKKKENADRDERVKKSLSINEFLKPPEGERYYNPGGRGRGRGRGDRGAFRGGFGAGAGGSVAAAPPIEDPGHFPTLGGK